MAYGVLYEFRRISNNGADMLITISQKDYNGEVKKRALGRAPVIKRDNNGHIYGTSCELYAECLVDGEFSHLYTSDAYEYKVEVYKNNTLIWMGYVSPELYSEPDIAPPYDVQIIATDGLGELKNFNFQKRGVASILDHLDALMDKTGIDTSWNVVSGLRYINENGAASYDKDILSVKIDLDHEEGNSYYDVLQNLLSSLNANITQHNGKYLIFRETDFINKVEDEGVEAFDADGISMHLPIASFGSMKSHQWWPVGQLSTVIEPAKNKVTLKAPDHYKNNVLDFDKWMLSDATFTQSEGAYSLPNQGSSISQSLDFKGQEVGYRLGFRVRARNVGTGPYGGTSDKEQNLGLKVEIEGRAFADYLGPKFWLIKSEGISSGYALSDYSWVSSQERSIEQELRNPSSADSAADAQNIDIVLPLFDDGTNMYGSYAYANKIKITIFNPAGIHNIYIYDVSLVKYEQIEGYQADVIIDNSSREAGSNVDLTMSSSIYAPAAVDIFMTGIALQSTGTDVIKQWMIGSSEQREYITAMAFDYSRAIALPKMKYAGILNVPGSEALLPTLFLRDGTYYFPKTYSYDLYDDEITVELLSISAADVSLGSVVISQTSEAVGTMGGLTTSGASGGGSVYFPRDKEMSDTSDNAVENRVIKAYVDNVRSDLEKADKENADNITDLAGKLNDMFYLKDGTIGTKYNFYSKGEISAGGVGTESEGGGGEGSSTLDGLMDVEIEDKDLDDFQSQSQVLGYNSQTGIWVNKVTMYHHKQTQPSAEWNIKHDLGKFPNVKIVDTLKQLCLGDVYYIDENNVTIKFGGAESGDAYLD